MYFLEGPPYCFCFAFASAVDCEGPHFNVLTFLPSHSSSPSPLSPLEHSPPSLSGKSYSLYAHCFFILSASSSSWFLFQSVSSLFFLMQHSAGLCHLTHAYFVHGSMLSALHGSISFNLRIIPLMARHLQSPFYGEMSLSEM